MGPGPVLGGKAGEEDYSLSSMLERAPVRKQEEPGKATGTIDGDLISIGAAHILWWLT